jgi:hypothetical protein
MRQFSNPGYVSKVLPFTYFLGLMLQKHNQIYQQIWQMIQTGFINLILKKKRGMVISEYCLTGLYTKSR